MPPYSNNGGRYADLNAAEAEACQHLDFIFEKRREQHQQQPEHAAELAQLPEDDEYGRFFHILQKIANGAPGFTVDDLSFSPSEDTIEDTISREIDRWRHDPLVVREYAQVFCWARNYHEMQTGSTCPSSFPRQLADAILESGRLGQLTAPSLRSAVIEFMIYAAVLYEECVAEEVFGFLVRYEPNIIAAINEVFDNFLDKYLVTFEQKLAYATEEDDALILCGVARVASSLWKQGVYTSPYAFVLILRIVLESGPALERDFLEEGKDVLINHSRDLRAIIVRGDLISENIHHPRERARYAFGPDVAANDHLPGGRVGLDEGRWAYWARVIKGLCAKKWDNEDIEDILFAMADAEDEFPVRKDLLPETFVNSRMSMEW